MNTIPRGQNEQQASNEEVSTAFANAAPKSAAPAPASANAAPKSAVLKNTAPANAAPANAASGNAAPAPAFAPGDPAPHKDRLWTGTFILIVFLTFLCFLTGQGVNSSMSVFIDIKGGSTVVSGMLAAVFSASAAAARFALGPLIDRFGRRLFMIIGFGFLLAGFLGPLLNTSIPAFVLWRFLQGVGFSSITSAASTAAADVLALSRMGEGIGFHGLGQAVAMSVGPAIGLFLVGTDPAENVFLGMSIIAVIGLALSLLCTYERHPERLPRTSAYFQRAEKARMEKQEQAGSAPCDEKEENPAPAASSAPLQGEDVRGWRRFIEPAAMPGVVPILVLSPLFGFSIYFCGLYGTALGVGSAGLYFTLSAITMIIVRLAGKSFMDGVGPFWLHAVAAACGAIAMGLLIAAAQLPVLYYVAGPFYGLCMGLGAPVNQSVVVKCTRADRWGVANSLFFLSQDIGIGIAAVLWGVVNDCFGFSVSLASAIVVAIASLVVAWFMYPDHGVHPLEARGVE